MTPAAHGGGGFALLLLAFRERLEHLADALSARGSELLVATRQLPAELGAAWHRVVEGTSPLALVALLLAVLALAGLARALVRRRLAVAKGAGDGCGRRVGRALYCALVDGLGLAAFALVALGLCVLFLPAGAGPRSFVFTMSAPRWSRWRRRPAG